MQPRTYRSVRVQTIYYLARPHSHVPSAPVLGPAAWHSRDHADPSTWTYQLEADDIRELEAVRRPLARRGFRVTVRQRDLPVIVPRES